MTELPVLPVAEIRPFVPYVWERNRSYYRPNGEVKEKRGDQVLEPLEKVLSSRQVSELELDVSNNEASKQNIDENFGSAKKAFHQRRHFPIYFNRENTVIFNSRDQNDDVHHNQGRLIFVRQKEATNLTQLKLKRLRTSSKTRFLSVNGIQLPTEDANRRFRKQQAQKFIEYWQPGTRSENDVKELERNRTIFFKENPNAHRLQLPKVNLTPTENVTTSPSQQLARETLRGLKEEPSSIDAFRLMVSAVPLSASNPALNLANASVNQPLLGGSSQPVTASTKLAHLPARFAALSISSEPTVGELSLRHGQRANRQPPLFIKKQPSPESVFVRKDGRISYPENFSKAILTYEVK